ncbi:MAG: efflux RND transporter periplasmic adaptor subunit [Chloroflexota bacterium]
MKTKFFTFFFVAAFLLAGCGATGTNSSQALTASGMIEATQVAVAPQLPGRVVAVSVAEGDSVRTGDVLFRLDDTLLQAQHQAASAALASSRAGVQTAEAGVAAAQAQYDLILSNALTVAQPERVESWKQTKPGDFEQPSWYFSTAERLQSTQAAVDSAKTALDDAQANLDNVEKRVGSAQFLAAEQRLSDARVAYQIAQDVLDQTNGTSDGQELHNAAQNIFDDAKIELDHAQQAYDDALTTSGAQDVLEARAKVSVALERYNIASDALRTLQTGANSPEVISVAKVVDQARATLVQAQAAVDQARAQLNLVEAQIAELTVHSPLDGVVLANSVEVGEVIQAGATAMTIGKLDQLKVTVYIPENRYGEIKLSQQATLSADSFPGESFSATVTRIADQAEFTPQNVQTTEGRQTTVYAVELSVDNSDGKLKPGMPVDVTFTPTAGK